MDLYGQEVEVGLLTSFISRLENGSVIDVGAERGGFAEEMLRAGSDTVYVIEPEPDNVAFLRNHFRDDQRVVVHEYAISDNDTELQLHVAVDADGAPLSFGHTVLDRPDTDEIGWAKAISVNARSLASLVVAGEIPARVGILKVDTEGHDLAVVLGMGELDCDVVMVEHWTDLPLSLGSCPWTTDEIVGVLQPRGFSHFAFIVHRGELVTLRWDDGDVPAGFMGNLIFLHDRVLQRLLPDVIACASSLAERAVELAEARTGVAAERLAVIEELAQAADERLLLLKSQEATISELTGGGDVEAEAPELRSRT